MKLRILGWRNFRARAARTWEGRLEPEEIRTSASAFAWLIPIVPTCLAAIIAGLVLQSRGASMVVSTLPMVGAMLYAALALLIWRHCHREAQLLVASRLGINPKAARRIDFRGIENFERSVAEARGAHDRK